MKISSRFVVVLICVLASTGAALYQAQSTTDLTMTTNAFLASLHAEQAEQARFDFDDEERVNWHFIPRERKGLPLKEMEPHQVVLAQAMMTAALGYRGAMKANTVISLEQILFEIEGPNSRLRRDPELYFFSVFGEPSPEGKWAWRVEGHHVAVNVTMDRGKILASTPTFLGSNPAEVREGPRQGLRALAAEEDLARELLHSLNATQRETTVIQETAFRDIVTSNALKAEIEGDPAGLAASDMTAAQRDLLSRLIGEYTMNRMAPEVAEAAMSEIRSAGFDRIHFAWAGSGTRGEAHYYRVKGPAFLIEYDNTQNDANHVHSVFRDLDDDFGGDVLRAHYEAAHQTVNAE